MTRDIWEALGEEHPHLFSCYEVYHNVPNVTNCKEIKSKSSMLQFHTDTLEMVKFDPEMNYWSDKILFGELVKDKDEYKKYEKMINKIDGCKIVDLHRHIDGIHMHFVCHENNESKSNAQMWEILKILED